MSATVVIVQCVISVLDLVGLALIMKIVLKQQGGINSLPTPILSFFPTLSRIFETASASSILVLIVVIFIIKGLVALILHSLLVRVVANETISLTNRLARKIFLNRTNMYKSMSSQDISFAIQNATEIVFNSTLVPVSVIITDLSLLILVSLNLFFSARVLFVPTVLYFVLVFFCLRFFEKRATRMAYKEQWMSEIHSRSLIDETNSSLRELYVSGRVGLMLKKIGEARARGIDAGSTITVSQLRPKYFYEMALFGGIGVIAIVSVYSGKELAIISLLTLFVISASRMIPSLLRIQFYLGILQKSIEQSKRIFDILDINKDNLGEKDTTTEELFSHRDRFTFTPTIQIENVCFSYDDNSIHDTIHSVSLDVRLGEMLAIVGPSGAGKSTLVDLLLGYQAPKSGMIEISGLKPSEAFTCWPGKVAYVPQKVTIYQGSLFENICIENSEIEREESHHKVLKLLQRLGLGEFVSGLPNGLDSQLSEFGSSLSGGQVQKIGIARALYTDPEIIVFDESTSSLDSISEKSIMDLLLEYKGIKTMIFIAHRLSTIQSADRILYINQGQIQAEGTFQELRRQVPDFNLQVEILNLGD